MKFKELREANLSKAQINKVHDKADDLPKSDFIKRYGKEGDAVRFATATNIIKKQLNIEALDKEDEKSIGDVIKGLKKAVKSHQGQVKSLTKDIQDEVEEDLEEGKKRFDTMMNVGKAKYVINYHDGKKKHSDGSDMKDVATFKNKPDLEKFKKELISKGYVAEEVEITEAVSDAYVKQIARMTDNNDHFGARIELARMMRDKELMQMYDSLEKMHRMNLGGNDALTLRSKLDKNLKFRLTQKVKKDADRLMGAL